MCYHYLKQKSILTKDDFIRTGLSSFCQFLTLHFILKIPIMSYSDGFRLEMISKRQLE